MLAIGLAGALAASERPPELPPGDCCAKCLYARPRGAGAVGTSTHDCRRQPLGVALVMFQTMGGRLANPNAASTVPGTTTLGPPGVAADYWCGEFKPLWLARPTFAELVVRYAGEQHCTRSPNDCGATTLEELCIGRCPTCRGSRAVPPK